MNQREYLQGDMLFNIDNVIQDATQTIILTGGGGGMLRIIIKTAIRILLRLLGAT